MTIAGDLVHLYLGFLPAQVVNTLAKLGIGDLLAGGERSTASLAEAADCDETSLRRLLRAATGLGLLDMSDVDGFTLTETGQYLRSDNPHTVRFGAMLFNREEHWRSWGRLEYSVRTGKTAFEDIYKADYFEYLRDHDDFRMMLMNGLGAVSRIVAPGIVAAADLPDSGTLVDVGGGNGVLLTAFLTAHPGLRGILQDLPEGVGDAADRFRQAGIGDRTEITVGDFFESVPSGHATYLLKSILHDWDDERCVDLLANIRQAILPGGRVIVAEVLVPTGTAALRESLREEPAVLMSDLNMLACIGGRERTAEEYGALLEKAGFAVAEVTRCERPVPVLPAFNVIRAVPA